MNTRTLIITFVWMIMSNIGICAQEHWDAQERIELNKGVFPKNFSKAIDAIQYDLFLKSADNFSSVRFSPCL